MVQHHDQAATRAEGSEDFDLSLALQFIGEWIPAQGPLKDFIHHNPLHAFQGRPFHEALAVAGDLYGALSYLSLEHYQNLYRVGSISDSSLASALQDHTADQSEQARLRQELFEPAGAVTEPPAPPRSLSVRREWESTWHIDLSRTVHPILFKLLSNFLDQGIAIWPMPHAHDSFWTAIGKLVVESFLPLPPLQNSFAKSLLLGTPEQAIAACLDRLVQKPSHYKSYLLDMALAHPGWSGMVQVLEDQPGSLREPKNISLKEVLALELLLEYGVIEASLGKGFAPLAPAYAPPIMPEEKRLELSPAQVLLKIWQEAWEETLYSDILLAFQKNRKMDQYFPSNVQAFFCIDDRECSLRRHLEELDPTIKTWSTAGFFGIDFFYQAADHSQPIKSCPVPVLPKHLVREKAKAVTRKNLYHRFEQLHLAPANTFFRAWFLTHLLGLWQSIRLALMIYWPSCAGYFSSRLRDQQSPGELNILRLDEAQSADGHWLGYTPEEMADRVQGVLQNTGCLSNFSPLMLMIGHGASSTNNPYFAAYDCGACSGKPGAPNARVFAWMANNLDVRSILAKRGIVIPVDTIFLAGFHDTTRDEIIFFDGESLRGRHDQIFKVLQKTLTEALQRNAKERCRRFALVDQALTVKQAHAHVQARAASIFEPRPELNHASNAICVIGRRELTKGLFLDRRAFLHSYDYAVDPSATILAGILSAVIPVCGGINLEYYFSRVDSGIYGAGSKLPQNIIGLIGVAHGVESDLLTGLPLQMTEAHDPIRLMIVVEQEPTMVQKAIIKAPGIHDWIYHSWVHLACISPTSGEVFRFKSGNFVKQISADSSSLPSQIDSLKVIAGRRDNISVHGLSGRAR